MRLLRPWQRAWHKAMLQTCEALSLSLVCWSGTLPILILQEHHISLVAILTNLLVVPPATPALAAMTLPGALTTRFARGPIRSRTPLRSPTRIAPTTGPFDNH